MRVHHVIDSAGFYGAEKVVLELASEHQKLGHTPVVVSIGVPGCGEKPIEREARARGLPVRPVRMAAGPSLRGALQLVRLAREEAADVIHSHGYKADILLGLLPKRLRPIPLVATVHGYTDLGGFTRMALYHRVDRLALRRADRVVLVHAGMSESPGLRRLRDSRRRIIENGIPNGAGSPPVPAEGSLDSDTVRFCERGSAVVGVVGRLSAEKGVDVMLRALAEIARRRDGVVALILGEGRERAALEGLARELGLQERVFMPGYRSNATGYLRLFDVFVLPSLTEGLPIVLLEAMQAGVPVVATRVGGVPSVLDGGRGGLLVEPGDPNALATAIERCLDDRPLASRLAAHARQQQSARFSSQAMAKRYADLYREVASSA